MNYLKNKIHHEDTPFLFLGLTILVKLMTEIFNGRFYVHSGELLSRFFLIEPTPFQSYFIFEAMVVLCLALMIMFDKKRTIALRVLPLIYLLSLVQYYSNHKLLIFIVIIIFNFSSFVRLNCLKSQLVMVYYFTVINKIVDKFYNGETLANTFFNFHHHDLSYKFLNNFYAVLSANEFLNLSFANITLLLEIIIPILLFRKSYWALVLMLVLHLSFSALISGILPFMLIMMTMGLAFFTNSSELTEQ